MCLRSKPIFSCIKGYLTTTLWATSTKRITTDEHNSLQSYLCADSNFQDVEYTSFEGTRMPRRTLMERSIIGCLGTTLEPLHDGGAR